MAPCKSLVVNSITSPLDPKIEDKDVPTAGPGTAVVQVLNAVIGPQSGYALGVPMPHFQFPVPGVYGHSCIGRVVSVGVDSTSLKQATSPRAMTPNVEMLMGLTDGATEKSKKLANDAWRDGCWTTHAVVPLENATPLGEEALVGGVSAIDVKAGETVIVGPATGGYGGAAFEVAAARGARVIAFGRNKDALAKLKSHVPRVDTVLLTGDVDKDAAAFSALGPADAYIDFSPFQMQNPTHVGAGIRALRRRGRIVLMGGMYTRKEIREVVKMAETGVLKIGKTAGHEVAGRFKLEDWEKAIEAAGKATSWGQSVVFTP
ncbi:hypothetical protein LQW54_000630 [Pestalotiopsis sp. IQ-011]